jgi:hypothetical protein
MPMIYDNMTAFGGELIFLLQKTRVGGNPILPDVKSLRFISVNLLHLYSILS